MSSSSANPSALASGSTVSSIYAAQPALPLLASSLLSGHQQPDPSPPAEPGVPDDNQNPTTAWNLKADFEKGPTTRRRRTDNAEDDDDSSSSYRHVFRCGVTIGFSWLKEQQGWNNPHFRSAEQDQSRERVGEVGTRIVVQ
jgi:hypothetical protein